MTKQTHDLVMPAFGADMATGTLIEWLVKEGDEVKRGDVVAVIETNKGAIELDVFEDTVIDKLLAKVDDEIRVGTSIARLRGPGPKTSENEQETLPTDEFDEAMAKEVEGSAQPPSLNAEPVSADDSFVLASPAARYQAKIRNLNLSEFVKKQGAPVTLKDLVGEPEKAEEKTVKTEDRSKQMMREAISDTVSLSKQTIPHYYLSHRLDITALQHFVSEFNQDKPAEDRVLLAAPMLVAIARLLAKQPQLNGLYVEGSFQPSSVVHLAHAVNVRGSGLIMPVIRDAEQHDASTIMNIITHQVAEARRGRLPMSQLTGGTCCVSSVGERGAEQMSAVILPPQVAIIALGSPHQQALVVDGELKVRDVIIAGLSADHRVSDGHIGAKFLYQLNKLIQKPEQLWTESNSINS